MRFKTFQGLLATTLLFMSSASGWAQPDLVGREFQVNQNRDSRQLKPVAAFSPSGHSLIVWENELHGILGRFYDRNGAPLSAELTLVGNEKLQTLPGSGKIQVRKDPALIYLPSGELLLFWTEERDYLNVTYFLEQREILEQDVRGQRFSATGAPLGASFRVNGQTTGFQRRPKAALRAGGVLVVWEDTLGSGGDSRAIYSRSLTRRGQAQGGELRIDSGQAPKIRSLAMAANPSGEALIAWEVDHAAGPNVVARLLGRDGSPGGAEFVANPSTPGRQRRPAVLATPKGDFLVAWQSSLTGTPTHGIYGQFYSSAGARVGSELHFTRGVGEIQVAPALALLPTGNIVVAWSDWVDIFVVGVYALVIDPAGRPLGQEVAMNQDRVYPQYQNSVAANAHGEILAVWEGHIERGRAIAARRLADD